jgi:hypothetical protein
LREKEEEGVTDKYAEREKINTSRKVKLRMESLRRT